MSVQKTCIGFNWVEIWWCCASFSHLSSQSVTSCAPWVGSLSSSFSTYFSSFSFWYVICLCLTANSSEISQDGTEPNLWGSLMLDLCDVCACRESTAIPWLGWVNWCLTKYNNDWWKLNKSEKAMFQFRGWIVQRIWSKFWSFRRSEVWTEPLQKWDGLEQI